MMRPELTFDTLQKISFPDTLSISEMERLGYEALSLGGPQGADPPLASCSPFQPSPQLDGSLLIDPDIHLPSIGMDVDVAFYYNSWSDYNGAFGYGRTCNLNLLAQTSSDMLVCTLMRGNGSFVVYQGDGVGNFQPVTPGALTNTLEIDPSNPSQLLETTSDGRVSAYLLDTVDADPEPVNWVMDSVGNAHSFSYDGFDNLLALTDTTGRVITFGYDGDNLLQTVTDWADRVTTFLYDKKCIPDKPVLSQMIGPCGEITCYKYAVAPYPTHDNPNNKRPLLTTIIDPNGYTTTYAYDSQWRVSGRTIVGVGTTSYQYTATQTIVTDAEGYVWTYTRTPDGRHIQMQDPVGGVSNLYRNANLQETSRVDHYGHTWQTFYDAAGNPQVFIDPLGQATTILHDAFNNPTQVQYPDGTSVQMIWGYPGSTFDTTGERGRLQVYVDELGARTTYLYETSTGLLFNEINPLGFVTTYGYDFFGNLTVLTDAEANTWGYQYDDAGNLTDVFPPVGGAWHQTFDNEGRPLTYTDPRGYVTTYQYDAVGNLIRETNALGQFSLLEYNAFDQVTGIMNPLGKIRRMRYDRTGRRTAEVNELGYATTTQYDGAGRAVALIDPLLNTIQTVYDLAGRVVAHVDANGNRTTTNYDNAGRPITQIDAMGYVHTTVFDPRGRIIAQVDPLGNVATTLFDAAGRLHASIDALGYRTTYNYDAAGRMVTTMDSQGSVSTGIYDQVGRKVVAITPRGLATTYTYDPVGRVVSILDAGGNLNQTLHDAAGNIVVQIDPLSHRTTYQYDELNRATVMVDSLSNRTTYSFDAAGRQTATTDTRGNTTNYLFDDASQQTGRIMPDGSRTTFIYDAAGRGTAVIKADGQTYQTQYDAANNVVAFIDPLFQQTTHQYDALNRPKVEIDPLGHRTTVGYDAAGRRVTFIDARGYTTNFRHDPIGRQTAVVDANSQCTTFLFDSLGRVTMAIDPLGNRTTYVYDADSNPIQRVDAQGQTTTYSPDKLNRITTISYSDGTQSLFAFDAASRLNSVNDTSGLTRYSYDAADRVTSVLHPSGHVVTYTLDPVGNRIGMLDPTGASTYQYDANNRLTTLLNPYSEQTLIAYDGLDRPLLKQLADGTFVSLLYDPAGRLLQHGRFNSDGTAVTVFTSTYDAKGNTLSISGSDGSLASFGYDETYQLTSESRAGAAAYSATYTYDPAGNRLGKTTGGQAIAYSYDAANRLTLAVPTTGAPTTYGYDNNGNMVTEITGGVRTTYAWDVENRLKALTQPGISETYVYGADRMRRKRTSAGTTVQYVWDAGQVLLEANAGGAVQARYTHEMKIWSSLLSQRRGTTSNFYVFDPQGNARNLNSVSGGVVVGIPASVTVRNGGTSGLVIADAVRFVPVAIEKIVDNSDATGVTITGSWHTNAAGGYSGGSYLDDQNSGKGSKSVKFTPNLAAAGAYQVYAWWKADVDRATNVPIDIAYQAGSTTVVVDQQNQDSQWVLLGTFQFLSGTTGSVTIRNAGTSGLVIADAVRFVPVAVEKIVDNSDATGVTITGSWHTNASGGYSGGSYLDDQNSGKGSKSVKFAPTLAAAGAYQVYAWWKAGGDRATNVPMDVTTSTGTTTVTKNQQTLDSQWVLLGTFTFDSVTANVTDSYSFDAFGNSTGGSGSTVNPFQYGGQSGYYQDAANRRYVRARYLHDTTGRWMSRDPIGFEGGINLYQFCINNPVFWSDPTGLDAYALYNAKKDAVTFKRHALHAVHDPKKVFPFFTGQQLINITRKLKNVTTLYIYGHMWGAGVSVLGHFDVPHHQVYGIGLYDRSYERQNGYPVSSFADGHGGVYHDFNFFIDYAHGAANFDQFADAIVGGDFKPNALIVLGGCHGAYFAPVISWKLELKGKGDIRIVGANAEANGTSEYFVVQREEVPARVVGGRNIPSRIEQGHLVLFQHGRSIDIFDPKNFFITPTNKGGTLMP